MKKVFTKALSVVLSIVIVLSSFAALSSVGFATEEPDGTNIPVIYVPGKGATLRQMQEDGSSKVVFPVTIPEGFIEATVSENIGIFAKAVLTQQWEEFGDVLADALSEIYGVLNLDEHGKTQNGVYLEWSWTKASLNPNTVNGKYPTQRYTFLYDWRLDPYENAEILRRYIEDVREVTGADKVAMVGRCLGATVSMAYMEKYDAEYISDFVLYSSALDGATQCSKAFAGEFELDPDGIERFVYDYKLTDDTATNQLIQSFVTVFNKTYGLDITCAAVNNVLQKKYLELMPKALMSTYATFPGYWSMVNERDYDRAKEVCFYAADKEKYSDFIAMLDNYHYNVQMKSDELLLDYSERGIDVSNITKYGYQTIPITSEADMISDVRCSVTDSSKGATTATILEGFDDAYIEQAKLNGTDKYISPDRLIDASTCVMPETTWFINQLPHRDFPAVINKLIDKIINNDGYTINSDEAYPQYLLYTSGEETLTPLTAENAEPSDRYETSFFDSLKYLINYIIEIIKKALFGIFNPA